MALGNLILIQLQGLLLMVQCEFGAVPSRVVSGFFVDCEGLALEALVHDFKGFSCLDMHKPEASTNLFGPSDALGPKMCRSRPQRPLSRKPRHFLVAPAERFSAG